MKIWRCVDKTMDIITYEIRNTDLAISIMKEAAKWLVDIGKPLWRIEDISAEKISNKPEEYIVMKVNGVGAAAMILSFQDAFFWPDIAKGESGFIHKLSIRRDFAGKGYSEKIIEYAKQLCMEKGIHCLRLDCDPNRQRLCDFYEKVGFVLKEVKKFKLNTIGEIDCVMYELYF